MSKRMSEEARAIYIDRRAADRARTSERSDARAIKRAMQGGIK